MAKIPVSEARARMSEILKRVQRGEDVALTRHGEIVALWVHASRMLSSPDHMRDAEALLRRLRRRRPRSGKVPVLSPARAEQLVRELREERDAG
jgi:antitoxin (DNA-binding transcriptional repressor) of toxin-antitoxin stability system